MQNKLNKNIIRLNKKRLKKKKNLKIFNYRFVFLNKTEAKIKSK